MVKAKILRPKFQTIVAYRFMNRFIRFSIPQPCSMGGRKMSIARSHMKRAIDNSMTMSREQEVKRRSAGDGADGTKTHGVHRVRVLPRIVRCTSFTF
jgi:hypothetical protein